jgi:hypothetical protein
VKTECTYDNTTNKTLTFGESSDTEMCFSVLFRYPALGVGYCTGGARSQGDAGTRTIKGPPCAAAGAPGNELGVGKECARSSGVCSSTPSANICLNDFVSGDFGNFCTLLCQSDADCGTGAKCGGATGQGGICIPNACVLPTGSDAGAPKDGG